MKITPTYKSLIVKAKQLAVKPVTFSKKAIKSKPILSFLASLGLLFALIVLSNFLRKPNIEESIKQLPVKDVEVYQVGSVPTITVQAKIEKTGVLTIGAQTSGVVTNLNVYQGQQLYAYQQIAYIGSNYYGSNPMSVQRQLAKVQFDNTEASYPLQKDLISKQREIADKTDQNNDELRKITENSIQETKDTLSLQEDILNNINDSIQRLESENTDGSNDELIFSSKQLKAQYQSAINQLRSGLRQSQYQAGENNPPAALSNLSKDVTRINLDLQDKALDLGKEVAKLNYRLAQASENMLYPATPCAGVVERLYVKQGQQVNPGQPLVAVSCHTQEAQVIALVSQEIAQGVSKLEASKIKIGNTAIELVPDYVSTEATDGRLFNIHYQLPSYLVNQTIDKEFVEVSIPMGYTDTGTTIPFVPLDTVFQTQDRDQLFVIVDDKAQVRDVELGDITGNFVQIVSGLQSGDRIIMTRTVQQGDPVRIIGN